MFRICLPLLLMLIMATQGFAQTTDGTAPSKADVQSGNLTDQQKHVMENFTHQGYQQREADDLWAKECGTSEDCKNIRNGGNATDGEKFMGMSPSMFKAVGQAYSMIMPAMAQSGDSKFGKIDRTTKADVEASWSERGMTKNADGAYEVSNQEDFNKWNNSQPEHKRFGDDGTRLKQKQVTKRTPDGKVTTETKYVDKDGKLTDSPDEAVVEKQDEVAAQEETDAEEKEGEDYCQYIPMGTEVIAGALQKSSNEFALATQPEIENSQSGAMYKQARAHKDRQKSVDIQRKGWGATTACYAIAMAQPGGYSSWTNYVKLGAAGLMTYYYMWEYDLHDGAAKKLTDVANQLSGKGKCNPVSDRDCYCGQPETQNDTQYCYPQIRQRMAQNNNYQVTCVDNNVKEDPTCACRQTNSCLDSRVQAKINDMYIPGGLGASLDDFYKMTNGVSSPGGDTSTFKASNGKLFAFANDKLKENLNKVKIPDSYKKKDEGVASTLRSLGFDGAVANALSAAPETKESKAAEDKLKRSYRGLSSRNSKVAYAKKRDNGLYFRGGSGLDQKKSNKKNQVNPFADFMKKKKKKNAQASAEILDFSQKAQRNAGITKDKSRNIFEIISRRYRYTASKKLGVQ